MDTSAGKERSSVIGGGDLVTVIAGSGSSHAWRRPHLSVLRNRTGRQTDEFFVAPKNIHTLVFI